MTLVHRVLSIYLGMSDLNMVSNSSTPVRRRTIRTYVVLYPDRYLQAMPAIFVVENVNNYYH